MHRRTQVTLKLSDHIIVANVHIFSDASVQRQSSQS